MKVRTIGLDGDHQVFDVDGARLLTFGGEDYFLGAASEGNRVLWVNLSGVVAVLVDGRETEPRA